jgi:hypothetical protein
VRRNAVERAASLAKRREAFLGELAWHCDVEKASRNSGVSLMTVYHWRRTEEGFAAEWADAVVQGYQMLEARLIAHALAGNAGDTLEGLAQTPLPPLNIDLAIRVLGLQRRTANERPGRPRQRATRDDTVNELLRRLDMVARRKRAEAARAAAQDGGAGA